MNMEELQPVLTNNIAAIVMAGIFIWYLVKRDKIAQENQDQFNKIISNHLDHATQAQKEESEAKKELAVQLEKLSSSIKNIEQERSI